MHESHFDPCKKGMIEFVLIAKIPKMPIIYANELNVPIHDFSVEIMSKMGFLE